MPLFFVTLLPPDDLREKIREIKREVSEKYQTTRALRLPAHITLIPPFRLEEEHVPELRRKCRSFSFGQSVFTVELKDFGAFPPKVIFLEVANPAPVEILQRELYTYLKEFVPQNGEKKEFRPHITVATRDIHRTNFKKAWKEVSERKFSAAFEVDALYLFIHDGKQWDLAEEYSFSREKGFL